MDALQLVAILSGSTLLGGSITAFTNWLTRRQSHSIANNKQAQTGLIALADKLAERLNREEMNHSSCLQKVERLTTELTEVRVTQTKMHTEMLEHLKHCPGYKD